MPAVWAMHAAMHSANAVASSHNIFYVGVAFVMGAILFDRWRGDRRLVSSVGV